jgi:hypothetical protein
VKNVFNRTINYLKNSHESPDIKNTSKVVYGDDYNSNESNDIFGIEQGFEKEVEKYNRIK